MLVLTKNGEIKEKESYKLKHIGSRGNGRYSLELNPFALSGVITNYPEEIPVNKLEFLKEKLNIEKLPDELEFRGEAVIPKNDHSFKKYGKDAVWRNIASGMFNRIIPFNLKGLIDYLNNTYEGLLNKCYDPNTSTIILEPKFQGRKCITPEVFESAKLITSLFEDKIDNKGKKYKPFKRGDILRIFSDNMVGIYYSDGEIREYYDDFEELDIVFYSMSINGSNIDLNDLDSNKELNKAGFKTIEDVDFEENSKKYLEEETGYSKIFKITSNRNELKEAINEFYGINPETGKRCSEFPRLRNMHEYACDGVVIKPVGSNKYTQNVDLRLGRNNKIVSPEYPTDQIAIKLLSEVVKVKLVRIETKTTSLGNQTCTGILDKAYKTESGAMVSNVNLHNPEWLKYNSWIQEGEEYNLVMSLDIIPILMNPNL